MMINKAAFITMETNMENSAYSSMHKSHHYSNTPKSYLACTLRNAVMVVFIFAWSRLGLTYNCLCLEPPLNTSFWRSLCTCHGLTTNPHSGLIMKLSAVQTPQKRQKPSNATTQIY